MSEVVGIVVPLVRDGSIPKPIHEIKREDVKTDFEYPCVLLADCFTKYFNATNEHERRKARCKQQVRPQQTESESMRLMS